MKLVADKDHHAKSRVASMAFVNQTEAVNVLMVGMENSVISVSKLYEIVRGYEQLQIYIF